MNETFIQKLQETFGDLETLNPEKLKSLMQETLEVFNTLQEKMQSKEVKEQEEGLKMALQLKEAFEKQAERVCLKIGMSPTELAAYVENASNFTQAEWEPLNTLKQEVEDYRKQVLGEKEAKTSVLRVPKKKKRSQRVWLAS